MADIFELEFKEKKFFFYRTPTAGALINEIFADNYKIFSQGIQFEDGDVILDIGANEGMFSIMMAKMFPMVKVVSFEPVPRTFFQMVRNIGLNGVTNIEPFNVGVGGNEVDLHAHMNVHKVYSGGSSLVDTYDPLTHDRVSAVLRPLDEIIMRHGPIALLKIDIEGGEYEALHDCTKLADVKNVVGEFHINPKLQSKGYSIEGLAEFVKSKTNLIHYELCRMAD